MGALAAGLSNVVGQGVGLSKSAGLFQELTGQPGRVQIVQPGYGCILQFDVCINEQHQRDIQVTTSPLESGGVVSDHLIVQPISITLTGVVTDTPLYDAQRFLTQSIGNAAASLVPPLGVVAAATAYQLAHPQDSVTKRSQEAYRTLMRLAAGDPSASPPTLPAPFTVLTTYARYPNMVVKSLQFPRDAGTNGQCVFTLAMEQVQIVTAQTINVAVLREPALGAAKKVKGEQEMAADKVLQSVKLGESLGQQAESSVAESVSTYVGKPLSSVASFVGLGG